MTIEQERKAVLLLSALSVEVTTVKQVIKLSKGKLSNEYHKLMFDGIEEVFEVAKHFIKSIKYTG